MGTFCAARKAFEKEQEISMHSTHIKKAVLRIRDVYPGFWIPDPDN
jgi:hypothetical protein